MPNTKVGTTWAPDIRPEKIETFEETYTPEGGEEQTLTYKAVAHHPIISSVLDKLAFFRTHVGAVWYNLAERKTLLTKLNELDAELRDVNAKIDSVFQSVSSGKASVASAITAKGVTTKADATFATMAANIRKISVSPQSLSGSFYVDSIVAHSTWTQQITFSKAFASIPKITIGANSNYCTVTASNITKTGFTANVKNNASSTVRGITVSWSASI